MPTFINNAASVFICNKRFFIEVLYVMFLKSVDYADVIFLLQNSAGFCLFDLILYVHSTIFQLCGTGLPGLNQY